MADRRGAGGRPMAAALAVATAACALPLVARFLTTPAPAAVLAAFGTLAVLPTLVVLTLSAATRHLATAVAAAVLALAQLALLVPQVASDRAPDGTPLTVMTVNLNLGAADAAAVVEAVRRHRVEVLSVQELTVDAERRLDAAGIGTALPYKVTDPGGSASGTGLWASRPLARLAPWQMTFRSSAAALTVAGRRVVVRSVHPFPPRWSDVSRWRADLTALRTSVAGDDDQEVTVLLGDLNATGHHRELRRVMAEGGWRDAGELVGAGVVRTWSPSRGVPPLL
ncbi:MAG: endonuclease/exonuclease/phosphatase family protein, partial [Frankiales bacterium]